MVLSDTTPIEGKAGSNRLVVLMHGWCGHFAMFSIKDVEDTVKEELPDADLMVPTFPSGIFSNTNLNEVCRKLAEAIDLAVEDQKRAGGEYQEIILIGFSLGTLIVRMTYLIGCGDMMAPYSSGVMRIYPWHQKVSRIILLAGNNRGWSMDPKPAKLLWRFYLMFRCFGPLRLFGLNKLIFSYKRGQPFVENLRIQWLRREQVSPIPPTIHLYGEEEDLVSREDMLDQQYCANFILINVPGTGHSNAGNFHEPDFGPRRRDRFVRALTWPINELKQDSQYIPPSDNPPEELGNRDRPVTDVVFVIHGIRDWGGWTTEMSRSIDRIASEHDLSVNVIAPAYERFPMFGFLMGWERRKKVEWFVNAYTRAFAAHPDARFHFIGHSNGTYLLAKSLELYEMMQVDRVAFAGSVVRRDYPWDKLIRQGRAQAVRNDRAADDIVVAVFPRFFELLKEATRIHLGDIGGAGVFGFQDDAGRDHEVLIRGGHGAAVESENHASLARYVLGLDEKPKLDEAMAEKEAKRISAKTEWLARFCWLIWLGLAAIPVLLIYLLTIVLSGFPVVIGPSAAFAISFVIVGIGIWWLLKTF